MEQVRASDESRAPNPTPYNAKRQAALPPAPSRSRFRKLWELELLSPPKNDPVSDPRSRTLTKLRSLLKIPTALIRPRQQPSAIIATTKKLQENGLDSQLQLDTITTTQHAANPNTLQRHANSSTKDAVRHEPHPQCTPQELGEFIQLEKGFFVAPKMDVEAEIHRRWEDEILPNLIQDRGNFGESRRLKTHEANGREELKMAGPKGEMKPTIIITCYNEAFKRAFEGEAKRWKYLNSLGVPIRVIQEPRGSARPRLAASPTMPSKGASHIDPGPGTRLVSCHIEQVDGCGSACGLRLRFVVEFDGSRSIRFSVLGGLVLVGDKVYGLTTGHSIMSRDTASLPDSNSIDTVNLDSDHLPGGNLSPARNRLTSQDLLPRQSSHIHKWKEISRRVRYAFAGQYCVEGEEQSPVLDDKCLNSDWALVPVDSHDCVENGYQDSNGSHVSITETVPLDQLKPGPVLVLSGRNQAESGFLGQNSSVLHMGNSPIKVRTIMMDESIGLGVSGSWVVRDGRLCGYIAAIQDSSPWAYMIPIDGVFENITSVTGSKPVRLILENDIETVKPRRNPRVTRFTLSTPSTVASGGDITPGTRPLTPLTPLTPPAPHLPTLPAANRVLLVGSESDRIKVPQIPIPLKADQKYRNRHSSASRGSVTEDPDTITATRHKQSTAPAQSPIAAKQLDPRDIQSGPPAVSRETPYHTKSEDNEHGAIDNPLIYLTRSRNDTEALKFAHRHFPESDLTELFIRAARVARDPLLSQELPGLTQRERSALIREPTTSFWAQPKGLRVTAIVLCIAAITQGWNQAGFNGANLTWPTEFGLADQKGQFKSTTKVFIFALVNAATYFVASFGGYSFLHLPYGGRAAMFVGGLFCFASVIGGAFTRTWPELLACRILLGIGVGANAVVAPIMGAEISPAHLRGTLVMNWQLFNAFGIFLGFSSNLVFSRIGPLSWRLQIATAFFPAALLLVVVFMGSESPRILVKKRRYREAYSSLLQLRETPIQAARDLYYMNYQFQAEARLISSRTTGDAELKPPWPSDVREQPDSEGGQGFTSSRDDYVFQGEISDMLYFRRFRPLFLVPRIRRATLAASVVMVSQQLCGVNVFAFYSSTIFRDINTTPTATDTDRERMVALWISWGLGLTNFLFTLPAFHVAGTVGRRSILLSGFPLLTISMMATSVAFIINDNSRIIVIATFVFIFFIFYSPSGGAVPYTYSTEAFPLLIHEVGMSYAVFCNLYSAGILALFVPPLTKVIGQSSTLGIFTGLNFLAFILVFLLVPETGGKSLKELNYIFGMRTHKHILYQIKTVAPWAINRYVLRRETGDLPLPV